MQKNQEAIISLFNGDILEANERYYRYCSEKNEIQYTDNKNDWNTSQISINEFLKWTHWQISKP